MSNLKQALRKVISTSSRVEVRFDIKATINSRIFPSDVFTAVVTSDTDESALHEANSWLVSNLPALVESNITRAEMILVSDKNNEIKNKQTIRIEDLAAAYEASASPDTDQDRILGLWQGPELNDDQKEFLTGLYKDYHSLGEGAVDTNELFERNKSRAYDDIVDRLWEHPKSKEAGFVEKLARGDKLAMEDILYPSGVKGYAVDFAYEMYEKYFMDSVPVRLDDEELEEKGLKEAEEEVDFLARAAITDGCEETIGKCARDWIEEEATKWLSDKQNDETDQ